MKVLIYEDLRQLKGIAYQRDHLRRKCKAGEFPRPIPLSARRIGWIEAEIDDWLIQRAAARDGTAPLTERSSITPQAAISTEIHTESQ